MDPDYVTKYVRHNDNDVLVLLDPTVTDSAQSEAVARECINRVQKLRKKAGLQTTDDIRMEFKLLDKDSAGIKDAIMSHEDIIMEKLRGKLVLAPDDVLTDLIMEDEVTVGNVRFLLRLLKL
jgi:isoleucyl-tRNA synthetase